MVRKNVREEKFSRSTCQMIRLRILFFSNMGWIFKLFNNYFGDQIIITLFSNITQPGAACILWTCSEDMNASLGYSSVGSPPLGTVS